jgi:hypothetical protein
MPEKPKDIQRLSPDKLLEGFRRIDMLLVALGIALGVHILMVGVTSYGYIRDTYIDPEGAARREAAAKAEAEAEAARKAAAEQAAAEQDEEPAPDAEKSPAEHGTADPMEANKDHPEVQEVTSMPEEGEIPDEPDLGISIDDTNP